jgi:colanic acid/amylovoran biosynthesis glycosyltransferase
VLIAAMAALVNEGRDIRLRFAGDGPDRIALRQDVEKRGLSDRISFEGNVNQDKLLELYRESDALVLSSFAEGLPVVLMEAMAMEIPCVAPGLMGFRKSSPMKPMACWCRRATRRLWPDAIGRLMDDAALRRTLGQKARLKILEKFDLRAIPNIWPTCFAGDWADELAANVEKLLATLPRPRTTPQISRKRI